MAVNQATGYNRTTKEPLDALYLNSGSVYASIAAVNAAVNINVRYTGSRFNVNGEDYWYKNGVQDSDLVVCVDKNSFATTQSFQTFTQSVHTYTQSNDTRVSNTYSSQSNYTPSSSFNAYTQSVNIQLSNIYISESNYLPTASFNPISSSFDARVLANSASIYSIVHNSGSLATLTDVVIASLTPGQALVYDTGTSKWKNASFISASISGNAATATNVAASGVTGGAALSLTDDTNITISQTGSTTALLAAKGLIMGWTGTLADSRITSSGNWNTAYNYSQIGHLPLSGGYVAGRTIFAKSAQTSYSTAALEVYTSDGGETGISFHRGGVSAGFLSHGSYGGLRWNGDQLLMSSMSSVAPTANSLVLRDGSGYVEAVYFKATNTGTQGSGLAAITGKYITGDGYLYEFNAAAVRAFLSLPSVNDDLQAVTTRGASTSSGAVFGGAVSAARFGVGEIAITSNQIYRESANEMYVNYSGTGQTIIGNAAGITLNGTTTVNRPLYAYTGQGSYAISLGGSGGDYGSVGYNVSYTTTSSTYNYKVADYASFIRFTSGGFQFFGAPHGSGAMSPILKAILNNSGNLTIGSTDGTGSGNLYAYSGIFSNSVSTLGSITSGGIIYATYTGGNIYITGSVTAGQLSVGGSTLYLADWATGTKGLTINLTNGNTSIGGTLAVTGDINTGANAYFGNYLFLNSKLALRGTDTYLRLNQNGEFADGIYTPYSLRTDGTTYFGGTTYYINSSANLPATTIASSLTVNGPVYPQSVRNPDAVSADNGFGIFLGTIGEGPDYSIRRSAGAWSSPYPTLDIRFYTGIKIGADYGHGGTRFYNSSNLSTMLFSIGETDNNIRMSYSGSKLLTQENGIEIQALQASYFGYNSSYAVLQVGDTRANRSIAFGVDLTGNPAGSFNGTGLEYIWKNVGKFITPNASNNGYNALFSWSSAGNITYHTNIDMNGAAITNPSGIYVKGSYGGINLIAGNSTHTGYMEWFKGDGSTRQAYIGYDNTNLTLVMESGEFQVTGTTRLGILYATNGNFSGALTGTSATFNGGINQTGTYPSFIQTPTAWASNFILQSGVDITASSTGNYNASIVPTGKGWTWIVGGNGGTSVANLSTTGAATFSSTVSLKGGVTIVRSNSSESSIIDNEGNLNYNAQNSFNHVFKSNGTEIARISSTGAATFASYIQPLYFRGGAYELLFNSLADANLMHHDASNLYVAGNIYVGGNGWNTGNLLATQSYVTSISGAYLPLAGGTLTGGLTGTTAILSGNVATSSYSSGTGGYNFGYSSNAASRKWRIVNDITVFGDFAIQQSTTQTGSTFADAIYFDASRNATFSGAATFSSSVTATSGFIKSGYSDSYFLLAGGGAVPTSTYAVAANYLPLAGGTMLGGINMGAYNISNAYNIYAANVYTGTVYSNMYRNTSGDMMMEYASNVNYFGGGNASHSLAFYAGGLNRMQLSTGGSLVQNATVAYPNAKWGMSGTQTGPVVIKIPGGSANYGMIHMTIAIYEYNSNAASTITVGGYNWSSGWYSTSVNVEGYTNKQVRLGFKDGQYCVVIGDASSTWSYGQVVVMRVQNGEYYSGSIDLGGTWSVALETDSYTAISGDLRTLRTPNNMFLMDNVMKIGQDDTYGTAYNAIGFSGGTTTNAHNKIFAHSGSSAGLFINAASGHNVYLRSGGSEIGYGNTGNWHFPQTTASSSTTSGALTVIGGIASASQIYSPDYYTSNGWYRSNTNNTGLYSTANGSHFYASGSIWKVSAGGASNGGFAFYGNHESGLKGYAYWDGTGFGLLNAAGGWAVRTNGSSDNQLYGIWGVNMAPSGTYNFEVGGTIHSSGALSAGGSISTNGSLNALNGLVLDPGGIAPAQRISVGGGSGIELYDLTLSQGVVIQFATNSLGVAGSLTATSIIKSGGTSSQYLMADGSVTSTTTITSGSFTPTLTNTTNISSSSLYQATYIRYGSIVNVSVTVSVDPSSAADCTLTFSLPVTTSNGSQAYISTASIKGNSGTYYTSGVGSVVSTTTGDLIFTAQNTGTCVVTINMQYIL